MDAAEKHMTTDYGQHIYEDVSSVLNPQSLNKVLEFGCGGGWNLQPFARAGRQVLFCLSYGFWIDLEWLKKIL